MSQIDPENAVSDKMLSRVRALISKAMDLEKHGEGTPEANEAKACRLKADALMLQYAIDQATLDKTRPAAERQRPTHIVIQTVDADNELKAYFARLSSVVGEHTRCTTVLNQKWMGPETLDVFGFESDVRYFEILYTTLMLHMSGVFFPRPDSSITLEENLLNLRELGMNWLDMAAVYGWEKMQWTLKGKECWRHRGTGEEKTNYQLGGQFKRDFYRAAKAAGIEVEKIASADSRRAKKAGFRANAADGYVDRLRARLRASKASGAPGTELVLRDRFQEVIALRDEVYGELKEIERPEFELNIHAYLHGQKHADKADLNTSGRMGSSARAQIGG